MAKRWGNSGNSVKLYFLGSKITADGDCSRVIRKRLVFGRKAMTNLDSILKSRDITLPTKVRLVKAIVFPVVMYRCESWTVKKAECRRIDAFELWYNGPLGAHRDKLHHQACAEGVQSASTLHADFTHHYQCGSDPFYPPSHLIFTSALRSRC